MQRSSFLLSPVQRILGVRFYHFITFKFFADEASIRPAAVIIATLVLLISISIAQLRCLSKTISAHFFLERYWSSRACVLDFYNDSFFHAVCRSLFARQLDFPDRLRRYYSCQSPRHILFLASNCNRIKSNRGSARRSDRQCLSLF